MKNNKVIYKLKNLFFYYPDYIKKDLVHEDDHEIFDKLHQYQLKNDNCPDPDENEIRTKTEGVIEILDDYYLVKITLDY